MILLGLFVSNRNGGAIRESRSVRRGAGPPRRAGAEVAEKLAIRKYFLICFERVSSIFNMLMTSD